ncbi:MAG: CMP-N-acetylneuraminic acid synthetase [Azospirillum sp.]|nr:CMP-N-acetylneuraminic acid synthetase [Azospirillum sp.]
MAFEIAQRRVGDGAPAYIIAEGCDNHLGNLATALEMVRQAKLAGADAIKFQHHLPDEEMLPDAPMSDNFQEPLYEFLKKHALTLDQHRQLKRFCDEIGITFLCTPFSLKAAQELATLDVAAYKIGSGEMTDIPSLVRIAALGRPMIVSTGMSSFEEIDRTYRALTDRGTPLALLNCVSEYPPVYEDLNLDVVTRMSERYPLAVIGHSDHTPDLYTCFAAVTLGAAIIEKHVILDKRQPGPDQSVSIDFRDLANLVDGIRKIEAARGDRRAVHGREAAIRTWAFRSLVAVQPIPAGAVITEDMIWSKRPGTGIPSHLMAEVIGRRAGRDLPVHTLLSWDDLAAD